MKIDVKNHFINILLGKLNSDIYFKAVVKKLMVIPTDDDALFREKFFWDHNIGNFPSFLLFSRINPPIIFKL